MPQQLLYTVYKSVTEQRFWVTDTFLENNPEDVCGNMFIKQWTDAAKECRMTPVVAYTPLDHPTLTLQIRGDKSTMASLCKLAEDLTFDTQSLYETGDDYRAPVKDLNSSIEDFIYSRLPGHYQPENEADFVWPEESRNEQLAAGYSQLLDFNAARERGIAKEVAIQSLPHNLIVNATVTGSLGDWLRLLERVVQLQNSYEMKVITDKIAEEIRKWSPEIYSWWHKGNEKKKAKRTPQREAA